MTSILPELASPFSLPPRATAQDILGAIDEWALRQPIGTISQAHDLWVILTALRGPDTGERALKSQTTALLRGFALPNFSRLVNCTVVDPGVVGRRDLYKDAVRQLARGGDYTRWMWEAGGPHFEHHVVLAAAAILRFQR